jgi:hypothetical protein
MLSDLSKRGGTSWPLLQAAHILFLTRPEPERCVSTQLVST